jgi:hypothetical protein
MPAVMSALAQHRLASAIVAAACAATAGVFLFARPEYHPPYGGKALIFKEARPPAKGWTWAGGTPGFRFGQHRDEWNISLLRPEELVAARRAAVRAGVSPESLGVLQVSRTEQHVRPQVLLAGSDGSGRTCLGVQLHRGPVSFLCPPQLDRVVGFVVAEASPRGKGHALFLTGISRADVTRVTVTAPGSGYVDERGAKPVVRAFGERTVYERTPPSWWGTFIETTTQPRPWHAHVVFYGVHGRLSSLDVRFRRAGELFAIAR